MKGSVRPVRGTSRVTPPMMMKAWSPMMTVSPAARSCSKGWSARRAIRRPEATMRTKATMTAVVPRRPSSSPTAAKMKSVVTAGMLPGLPSPGPVPAKPPDPKA